MNYDDDVFIYSAHDAQSRKIEVYLAKKCSFCPVMPELGERYCVVAGPENGCMPFKNRLAAIAFAQANADDNRAAAQEARKWEKATRG
jgi:hypothetical protein